MVPDAITENEFNLEFCLIQAQEDDHIHIAAAISSALALITELANITPGEIAAKIRIGERLMFRHVFTASANNTDETKALKKRLK
jgi:hypothetical protein